MHLVYVLSIFFKLKYCLLITGYNNFTNIWFQSKYVVVHTNAPIQTHGLYKYKKSEVSYFLRALFQPNFFNSIFFFGLSPSNNYHNHHCNCKHRFSHCSNCHWISFFFLFRYIWNHLLIAIKCCLNKISNICSLLYLFFFVLKLYLFCPKFNVKIKILFFFFCLVGIVSSNWIMNCW